MGLLISPCSQQMLRESPYSELLVLYSAPLPPQALADLARASVQYCCAPEGFKQEQIAAIEQWLQA